MGGRRALLGADHRGRVWEPSQIFSFRPAFSVPITALAKVGFAHRSQSAGGFGNPLRVPIIIEERVGVEPTLPCGKHDFQSCPFGHSGISPIVKRTLGGSFKSPASSAVKQSLPSLTRILFVKRTLGGPFRSPASSAVKQSLPSLTRILFVKRTLGGSFSRLIQFSSDSWFPCPRWRRWALPTEARAREGLGPLSGFPS